MEINLVLAPDDAARLLRAPLLAAAQRSRPQQQRIVWHDSADAALAARGVALAQERGLWRLERLRPDPAEPWPPGAPARVLALAPDLAGLDASLPEPLTPVVAFAGRRQALTLDTEQGAITVTVLRGMLRAVTTDHAVCRLSLAGEDHAVLQAALAFADTAPLHVAETPLAGTALAAARGALPPAHHGAPALPDGLSVGGAFGYVLGHLAGVLLHFAPGAAADGHDAEPVHQMRVALRRLRSAMTIFSRVMDCDALRAARTDLKALNDRLGPARDWDVFVSETLPAVREAFPSEPRLARLAAAAERRRQAAHAALREFLTGAVFARLMILLGWLAAAEAWRQVPADEAGQVVTLDAFAADVLARRARKLRATQDLEALDPPALHAVRLQAKRARYAAEIFAPLFPGKAPQRFIHRVTALQNLLGTLNDATTAHRLLQDVGGLNGRHAYAGGVVTGFLAARAAGLRPKIARRWSRLQRARSFWE